MKNNEIQVSVFMGVYKQNDKTALEQAVDSILCQTFQDFEFLIYDDGCCVKEAHILEQIAKKDTRIRLLRGKKNKGLAYALNQCLQQAKGNYIARMDADDKSAPERLKVQKEFLDNHKEYAFVGLSVELFDEQGIWGMRQMTECPKEKDFLKYSPYIHPSVMFRKEVLEEVNGYFVSKDTLRCEDYELFMRLHCMGYHGYNLKETLFSYRENRNWYDKRTWQQRIAEMKIRYIGFQRMGILNWKTFIYVMKPVVVTLIPKWVKKKIRQYMALMLLNKKARKE